MDNLPALQRELISPPSELTPGSTPWSTGLGKLLLAGDDAGRFDTPGSADRAQSAARGALRIIAINPTLRAEAERLLPKLESAKALASREEIIAVMVREMPAWGVSTKHAGEYGVTYASYADALEGLPLYAIEEGVVRWNRGQGHDDLKMGGFPPRPAQLYALAAEARRELFMAAYRAKLALEYVEKAAPKVISEEERARNAEAIRAMLAKPREHLPPQPPGVSAVDWARQCREKGLVKPGPPPAQHTRPRVDQHAMAEQIRAAAHSRSFGAPISQKHVDDPGDVV